MIANILQSFWLGTQRHWWGGIVRGFAFVGAIWTLVEIVTFFYPNAKTALEANPACYLPLLGTAAAIVFFGHVYEPRRVSFHIPKTDREIVLQYGDLLSTETDWLIGVGEFFDSDIGIPVSKNSLHGQLITRTFNGDSSRFRKELDAALVGHDSEQTTRTIFPRARYKLGTTAVLKNGRHNIFLVAMARTDLDTSKASTTVSLLWDALKSALRVICDHNNGEPISMPLIGNGLADIKIAPQDLLRLLVIALVDTHREQRLPKTINIVLHDSCFDHLDVREIRRDWS
jgi:hypothetical protein